MHPLPPFFLPIYDFNAFACEGMKYTFKAAYFLFFFNSIFYVKHIKIPPKKVLNYEV